MKKIKVKNRQGENLVGVLDQADSDKMVVICHGRLCTKDDFFYPELAQIISGQGFNVFRFDFAGNGESDGKFEECTISKEIEDLSVIVDFLRTMGYSISSIIGHSMGGVVSLLYQVRGTNAGSLITLGTLADQAFETSKMYSEDQLAQIQSKGSTQVEFFGKSFKISKEYYDDRLKLGDITHEIKDISVPVLVLHGQEDQDTDPGNAKILADSMQQAQHIVVSGDHFFEGSDELYDEVCKFLKAL